MRYARLAFVAGSCGLTLLTAGARAADPVVVSQRLQGSVSALKGNLVYPLEKTKGEPYVCMRRVGGRLLRAHIPHRGCGAGDMVLGRRGRVIYLYPVHRSEGSAGVPVRWYAYDVKSDRTRRVTGLPGGGCIVSDVGIWRKRTVYAAECPSEQRSGVWAKDGQKTTRIFASTHLVDGGFVLRGGTLVGIDQSEDDIDVYQLMVGGKRCVRVIESAHDNLAREEIGGLWIANGKIVWTRGYYPERPPESFAGLFTAEVASHCAAPGPNGRFNFYPDTSDLSSFTLDGRKVYYADRVSIRRHTLPAEPTYAPPANDNFENAQSFAVGTSSPAGRTAWATAQPGEPLTNTKQTIWYTFTPATNGSFDAIAQRLFPSESEVKFGVYTGTSLATLTPVGSRPSPADPIQFDAVAGRQYWIDVGTSVAEANYSPLYVSVTTPPLATARLRPVRER